MKERTNETYRRSGQKSETNAANKNEMTDRHEEEEEEEMDETPMVAGTTQNTRNFIN